MTSVAIPLRTSLASHAEPTMLAEFSFGGPAPDVSFWRGWSFPEISNGAPLRWSLESHSDIALPASWSAFASAPGRILVEIVLAPFRGDGAIPSRRIGAYVDGRLVREADFHRIGALAFWLPRDCSRPLSLSFHHPASFSPAELGMSNDHRRLAFAFRALRLWRFPESAEPEAEAEVASAAHSAAEVFDRFESLGDNCEFGIVQRLSGIDPLALFRFSATPLSSLIDALLCEFDGLGNPDFIDLELRGERPEYLVTERRYNLTYHTFVYADQMSADRVRHREAQKLTLLRRRMLEDLRDARRIYVVKRNDGLPEEDVLALFTLLRRFGPNRLLHVAPPDARNAAGSVTRLAPGLVRGHIEHFAPYDDAARTSVDSWFDLCGKALALLEPA